MNPNVAVLGAGSWGTSLAILLARNGHRCRLWGHDAAHISRLSRERCNRQYLPAVPFPPLLDVTDDLSDTVSTVSTVILGLPSHAFAGCLRRAAPLLRADTGIAWATKGLETGSGRLLHEVVLEIVGATMPAAVISGPTFAGEVAAGLPTAVTVASPDDEFAVRLARILHNENFRAYSSNDIVGVQIGGAAKNVLAIAAGVADGIGFGANARAALITRGLSEIMRFGRALGARPETLMGLSGMGDLVLTCTDDQSRNRRFGLGLGRGEKPDQIAAQIGQEIEGIATARLLFQRAQQLNIDMPITEQVYRMLYQGLGAVEAVRNLLLRPQKPEKVS